MFGTAEEPGLIPKCLQSLFSHAGQRMDDHLSFKPDGLENLMPTSDCQFDTEIAARNYIFPDEKVADLRALHTKTNVSRSLASNAFTDSSSTAG